ncbi:hypothetical protein [Oricola sp.]|uniref:hypothetical protein n=1 Tax=Oricola sp. TaxID=1979950 RepID=UPI0025D6C54B|nr:hypothetical protein [Oricola sp.]MCI5076420.1 tetratricopeptide repeat protein [Oricola sp.]
MKKIHNAISDGMVDEGAAMLAKLAGTEDEGVANYYLGIIYSGAYGANKDLKKAVCYLKKASREGIVWAKRDLARAYLAQGELDKSLSEIAEIKDYDPECSYFYYRISKELNFSNEDMERCFMHSMKNRYPMALYEMSKRVEMNGGFFHFFNLDSIKFYIFIIS